MMTKTMMPPNTIRTALLLQLAVLGTWLDSYASFLNTETAFVSAFLVLMGSLYSYRNLVRRRLESEAVPEEKDVVDAIDDPYDLYDEETQEGEAEERPLKEVIKEEKARLKANRQTVRNVRSSAPALVSLYRVIPYAILVLGFIALNNNRLLDLWFYLPGLGLGIVAGYLTGKRLFLRPAA